MTITNKHAQTDKDPRFNYCGKCGRIESLGMKFELVSYQPKFSEPQYIWTRLCKKCKKKHDRKYKLTKKENFITWYYRVMTKNRK